MLIYRPVRPGLTISTGTAKKKKPTGYNSEIWHLISIVFEPISTQILKWTGIFLFSKEFFIFEFSSRRRRPTQDIKPSSPIDKKNFKISSRRRRRALGSEPPPPTSEKNLKILSRRRRSSNRLTPLDREGTKKSILLCVKGAYFNTFKKIFFWRKIRFKGLTLISALFS